MIEVLTQSSIGQFYRCAEQFRRRWIEGEIMPPGIAARIGTGVHRGAEVSNRAKMEGKNEPKSVIVDAAVEGYKTSCKEGGVWFTKEEKSRKKDILDDGADTTAALAGLFSDKVAPTLQPVAVEERIEMEVPGLDIPLAGIIDWREADPAKWPDLKTSGQVWNQEKADSEIQPTLYPRLIESVTGIRPTELVFHVLVKTKEAKYQPITTTRTDDDWRILIRKAQMMLTSIRAGLFQPADPGSWVCSPKWCGFWGSCPHISEHRRRLPNV